MLPPGLSLSNAGVISGSPTAAGTFDISVQVRDSSATPQTDTQALTIVVNPTPPPGTFSIGGTVTGLTGTVVLQNNRGDDLSASADGPFSFATALVDGADYAVTVFTQPDGQTCGVTNGSGTVDGADISDVGVDCVSVGTGSWQPYSDPIEADENVLLRVSNALVQMPGLAGTWALVAFREQASIHVNQIEGPPGPGLDRGRALEIMPGEAVIALPSLAVAPDGSTVLIAWHEGPFGSDGNVYVKRATGDLNDWTLVGGALDADPDADAVEPVVRIAAANEPVAAWREDGLPFIGHFDGTDWLSYGDSLNVGTDPVEQLRMALRPDSRPVLAWVETEPNGDKAAHAIEWDGLNWLALGSGVGGLVDPNLLISLAIGADDAPMVAMAVQNGAQIQVRRWNGAAWQDMGGPLASGVPSAPPPRIYDLSLDAGHALSSTGDAAPMVAWADLGLGTIVQRWDGNAWRSVGDVVYPVAFFAERVAVAAHDDYPAVLINDMVGGFIGRRLYTFVFVP